MEHYRAYGHYRRRRRNWRSILILVLLSVIGLIGLSAYQPVSALWRSATPAPTIPPTSAFATLAPTPPDSPAAGAGAFSFLATQTLNDVTIRIANARRDGDYFFLDVCHTKPDRGNWLLRGGTLEMGGSTVTGFGAALITMRQPAVNGQQQVTTFVNGAPVETVEPASGDGRGERCEHLTFELGKGAATEGPYALTFDAIRLFPDSSMECATYLQIAQAALDAQNSGVSVGCTEGADGAEVRILSKPDSLTMEDALTLATSGDSLRINGPWVFTSALP